MAVIVQRPGGQTVVVDRARTAAIVNHRPVVTRVNDRRTVETVQDRAASVAVASPGVQGARGAIGPSGGSATTRTAPATALGGHRLVRSIDAQAVEYVDSANPAHGDDTLGLTLGAADPGQSVDVQTEGPVTFVGWAWTPGEPVFAGRNGLLTQVAPDPGAGDAFSQPVGHAETSTTLLLRLQPPIYFD